MLAALLLAVSFQETMWKIYGPSKLRSYHASVKIVKKKRTVYFLRNTNTHQNFHPESSHISWSNFVVLNNQYSSLDVCKNYVLIIISYNHSGTFCIRINSFEKPLFLGFREITPRISHSLLLPWNHPKKTSHRVLRLKSLLYDKSNSIIKIISWLKETCLNYFEHTFTDKISLRWVHKM